ncbi:MAG: site-specific integrase, partial [Bacteroidales bacterium]|nr:site-specific integrase [Bacteroidales bacterium]
YAKAWGNLRAMFRGMVTYARRHGWADYYPDNILSDVDISRRTFKEHTKTDEDDCFSLEERQKIMEFITKEDERKQLVHHLGIMLLFLCGLRVGELAALKPEDIENGNIIHVQRTESRYLDENGKIVTGVDNHPKTEAGNRRVPVPDDYLWVLDEIHRRCPDGEWLLTYRGKRITACGYRKQLYKICDELGIMHKSPHKARKTYISILMENGTPDYLVERLAGHTDIRTSKQSYLRDVGYGLESDAVNKISEFKRPKDHLKMIG